jgi:cell pole-organizing protein PopZ
MNKPAAKEPSMDEILSSIRQIIADDDAAGVPRRPSIQAAPAPMQAAPVRPMALDVDRDLSDMLQDAEPLALSSEQIVGEQGGLADFSFDSILADTTIEDSQAAPKLVDPDDIAFDIPEPAAEAEDDLPSFDPLPMAAAEESDVEEFSFAQVEPEPMFQPEPEPSVAQAAPLPDPGLSAQIAEQLLEPATQAAVRSSISKLSRVGLGNPSITIEGLVRDMLRPMLKEWLDENLPAVVERMVEKEIARISRGD